MTIFFKAEQINTLQVYKQILEKKNQKLKHLFFKESLYKSNLTSSIILIQSYLYQG